MAFFTFRMPQFTKEPLEPPLDGRFRTTPSRYSTSSSILMWWGVSSGGKEPIRTDRRKKTSKQRSKDLLKKDCREAFVKRAEHHQENKQKIGLSTWFEWFYLVANPDWLLWHNTRFTLPPNWNTKSSQGDARLEADIEVWPHTCPLWLSVDKMTAHVWSSSKLLRQSTVLPSSLIMCRTESTIIISWRY